MQLKKPLLKSSLNIRHALAAATCSLLAAAPASSKADNGSEWEIESSVLVYSESDNRVTAIEPVISADKEIRDDEFLHVKVVLDALTGASPNGATPTDQVQTFTRPSGNGSYQVAAGETPLDDTFRDTRVAISGSWDKSLSRLIRRSLGLALSREFDYTSFSVNGLLSKDINNRNTTLQFGGSISADIIEPEGDIPTPFASMQPLGSTQPREGSSENKTTADLLFGVTQVLGHDTIGQLNYTFSNSTGYHTDPFKVLSVVDGVSGATQDVVFENRPQDRTKHSLYGEVKHSLGRDLINASYRFYTDDWGIDSHTIDLRYRWNFKKGRYLQPRIRWYQQSAADFYYHSLVAGAIPTEASADQRLADFSAITAGLKFGYQLSNGSEITVRGEVYQQSGDDHPGDTIGIQRSQDLFPETTAIIFQVGYSFRW